MIGKEISFRQNPLHIWDHVFRDFISDAPRPLRRLYHGQCQQWRIPNDGFQENFINNVIEYDLGSIASIESDLSFEDEKLYKW